VQDKKIDGVHHMQAFTAVYAPHRSPQQGDVISAGDYTIRLLDSTTGKEVGALSGHTGYVTCAKVSGRRLFTGSWDGTMRSWNLDTKRTMHVFAGHKNTVNAIEMDDEALYTASADNSSMRWDRATGAVSHAYRGHTGSVQCIRLQDDYVWTAGLDGTIRVYHKTNDSCLHVLRGNQGGIETFVLHPDAPLLFCGGIDCETLVLSYKKLKLSGTTPRRYRRQRTKTATAKVQDSTGLPDTACLDRLYGHSDTVYCLQLIEGRWLMSTSGDGHIRLWDIASFLNALYEKKSHWLCCI
jgi:WD40 repeat protein